MINLLLLNIYHTDEFKGKRKRRIIVYGSVTRYGPRNQLPAQGVNRRRESVFMILLMKFIIIDDSWINYIFRLGIG